MFAPTFRPASLRLILAIAGIEDMELRSVDVTSAFPNGDLEEDIYMLQPEGFQNGKKVLKLKKSLYGLKQAGRQWNKKLHAALSSMGFTRLESDRSIYLYVRGEVKIIVPIYIDDITLASKSTTAIDSAVDDLKKHFKIHDLGPSHFPLGVQIHRECSKCSFSLSQHQYIIGMLERYKMSDCNPVSTPMAPGLKLSKAMAPQTEAEVEEMDNVPYLNAVGSLQYLATMTRPDIAYAVSCLGRFNSSPGPKHWAAVKHLLRYCKGTMDYQLHFNADSDIQSFTTFCDASHGDCPDSGRSTGGYLTTIGGGAIGWSSKLQSVVALSTTEAEYIAAVEAGKEIVWMRNILHEMGYTCTTPSPMLIDNQSAVSVTKNPEHHGRMKHLDLSFYWLRDVVDEQKPVPYHIPGSEQVADLLTKPLALPKVKFCREKMGLY